MKELTDSIEIYASNEEVFNAIIKVLSSDEGYRMWNPEHRSCRWVKGKPFEKDAVLYVEEYLHGKLHRLKFTNMNIKRNRSIEYKLSFPMSIICPRGSFIIIQNKESCTFKATLSYRMSSILEKVAGNRIKAMKKHIEKEGERLKIIVESKL